MPSSRGHCEAHDTVDEEVLSHYDASTCGLLVLEAYLALQLQECVQTLCHVRGQRMRLFGRKLLGSV